MSTHRPGDCRELWVPLSELDNKRKEPFTLDQVGRALKDRDDLGSAKRCEIERLRVLRVETVEIATNLVAEAWAREKNNRSGRVTPPEPVDDCAEVGTTMGIIENDDDLGSGAELRDHVVLEPLSVWNEESILACRPRGGKLESEAGLPDATITVDQYKARARFESVVNTQGIR
jgi:hypothetical protein